VTGYAASGVSVAYPARYEVNNLEDGTPLYVGETKSDGTWLVFRFDETTGLKDYANRSNNTSVTSYSAAWAARASLTYAAFQTLLGV